MTNKRRRTVKKELQTAMFKEILKKSIFDKLGYKQEIGFLQDIQNHHLILTIHARKLNRGVLIKDFKKDFKNLVNSYIIEINKELNKKMSKEEIQKRIWFAINNAIDSWSKFEKYRLWYFGKDSNFTIYYKRCLERELEKIGLKRMHALIKTVHTAKIPTYLAETIDLIISLMFEKKTLQEKRKIESKNLQRYSKNKMFFFELMHGKYTLPQEIMEIVLSYMEKGLSYINSVGVVNENFYLLTLKTWNTIRIDEKNFFAIPVLVLENVKRVEIFVRSNTIYKEMKHIIHHIRRNVVDLIIYGEFEKFLAFLNSKKHGEETIFSKCKMFMLVKFPLLLKCQKKKVKRVELPKKKTFPRLEELKIFPIKDILYEELQQRGLFEKVRKLTLDDVPFNIENNVKELNVDIEYLKKTNKKTLMSYSSIKKIEVYGIKSLRDFFYSCMILTKYIGRNYDEVSLSLKNNFYVPTVDMPVGNDRFGFLKYVKYFRINAPANIRTPFLVHRLLNLKRFLFVILKKYTNYYCRIHKLALRKRIFNFYHRVEVIKGYKRKKFSFSTKRSWFSFQNNTTRDLKILKNFVKYYDKNKNKNGIGKIICSLHNEETMEYKILV